MVTVLRLQNMADNSHKRSDDQDPDFAPLQAQCEGVSVQYQLLPGGPLCCTPLFPQAASITVQHTRLFLLGDGLAEGLHAPYPGQESKSSVLKFIQRYFGSPFFVAVHDRNLQVVALLPAPPARHTAHRTNTYPPFWGPIRVWYSKESNRGLNGLQNRYFVQ